MTLSDRRRGRGHRRRAGDRHLRRPLRAHHQRHLRGVASRHAVVERRRDLGRVPERGQLPRRRRTDAQVRRQRAVAAGRLHGRLPDAAAVRRRAAPTVRLLHDPGLRRGAAARARHAPARRRDRAADQRLLPRPAAQGRGRDAARDHRLAVLGRRRGRGRDRRAQRRARRDARRHLRAGVPVLGEGVRDRVPRDPAAPLPRRAARRKRRCSGRSFRAPGPTARSSNWTSRRRSRSRTPARREPCPPGTCEYRRTPRTRSRRGSTRRPATSGRAPSRSPAAGRRC